MASWNKSVSNVFMQKDAEVIIGLTGRTGSGCSTIAKILHTKEFRDLDLHDPKSHRYGTTEDRKYELIYNYLQGERWNSFTIIEGSSVIFSFVLQFGYESFINFIHRFRGDAEGNNISIGAFQELMGVLEGTRHIFENSGFCCIENNLDHFNNKEDVEKFYKFFILELPKLKKEFQKAIKEFSCHREYKSKLAQTKYVKSNLYTFLFQQIGNNIRCSGNPYDNTFTESNFFDVAKRMDAIIRLIRAYNSFAKDHKTRICIDAIRNSYEAYYFKDIYSSFYLVSVNTENEFRKLRLGNLDDDELESLDEIEYDQHFDKEFESFYHQNLQDCLAISDIHIYNPQSKDERLFYLTEQICKYVCLMQHPGLITPTHLERCMQIAYIARLNSGCLSRQVGAVITGPDYSIKAVGWNDIPEGQIPCNLRCVQNFIRNKDEESFSEFELVNSEFQSVMLSIYKEIEDCECPDRYFSYCFKDIYNGMNSKENQVYTRSLHAEENAFLQIVKNGGQGIKGGKLFTTASPCELCAKKAYQLGIREIYYIDPYPGISIQHILTFGTSENPKTHLFHGAIGEAYISLFTPRIQIKDELKLISGIDNKKIAREYKTGALPITGITDIRYISRESRLVFHTRTKITEMEKASIEVLKEGLQHINKQVYWTGSSFDGFEISRCECNGDWTFENTQISQSPYTGTVKFVEPQSKGQSVELDTKIVVQDAQKIMIPLYSQMVVVRTEHLAIEVEAKNGLLNDVQCVVYADTKMSPDLEVSRSNLDPQVEDGIAIYRFQIDTPNLMYNYCIEWKFSEESC